MPDPKPGRKDLAPIYILGDDDYEASARLISMLPVGEWTLIPVHQGDLVVRYAEQFATTAVFLADTLAYPAGGIERLLQIVLDEIQRPVVILAEDWTPEIRDRWKRMGAFECVPHPTRAKRRADKVRKLMQAFMMAQFAGKPLEKSEGIEP
jgi:hypothetical protein